MCNFIVVMLNKQKRNRKEKTYITVLQEEKTMVQLRKDCRY